jgi:hypothetical protein
VLACVAGLHVGIEEIGAEAGFGFRVGEACSFWDMSLLVSRGLFMSGAGALWWGFGWEDAPLFVRLRLLVSFPPSTGVSGFLLFMTGIVEGLRFDSKSFRVPMGQSFEGNPANEDFCGRQTRGACWVAPPPVIPAEQAVPTSYLHRQPLGPVFLLLLSLQKSETLVRSCCTVQAPVLGAIEDIFYLDDFTS